jgi:hypothetical protein
MEKIQTNIFSSLEDIIFEGDKVKGRMESKILDYSPLESYITMIGELSDDIYIIARTQENIISKQIIELLDKLYYLYNRYRIELWYYKTDLDECEKLIIDYDSKLSPIYEDLKELYEIKN